MHATRFDYTQFFTRDPNILNRETVIRGTRVPLKILLRSLAFGDSIEQLRISFPSVSDDAFKAVVAFAAASAAEDLPPPSFAPAA